MSNSTFMQGFDAGRYRWVEDDGEVLIVISAVDDSTVLLDSITTTKCAGCDSHAESDRAETHSVGGRRDAVRRNVNNLRKGNEIHHA
jgi:hypothetical protein